MRTLILGGRGMLGRALAAEGRRRGESFLAPDRAAADITRDEDLRRQVEAFRPEVIVNCAAFTDVDACERRREHAFAVNGRAVARIAAAAAGGDCHLIHLSTDYVFDGSARRPYAEETAPAPLSVYGASKLEGERHTLAYPRGLVVRTSWLFGPGERHFVAAILRQLEAGRRRLRVVADQVGCPTYAPFLARVLWDLEPLRPTGILHYRNEGPVSWHGFATAVVELAGGTARVEPIPTSEMPRPAARPAYSVLDVGRVERLLGRRVPDWRSGLEDYLAARSAAEGPTEGDR